MPPRISNRPFDNPVLSAKARTLERDQNAEGMNTRLLFFHYCDPLMALTMTTVP
jgi:hypothetical protein